jgi:hypothetical protein
LTGACLRASLRDAADSSLLPNLWTLNVPLTRGRASTLSRSYLLLRCSISPLASLAFFSVGFSDLPQAFLL